MVVGDPKKAAVLGTVALAIISVSALEFIHKPAAPHAAEAMRAQDQAQAATEKAMNQQLPTTITSSPFAKPVNQGSSTVSVSPRTEVEPNTAGLKGRGLDHAPNKLSTSSDSGGRVPPAIVRFGNSAPPISGAVDQLPVAKPGENAVIDQKQNREQTNAATLDAVMKVERWIALVTVSGQDAPMHCEVGSKIGGYLVLEISNSGITVIKGRHIQTVSVGSSLTL
jgi:hypothetical protein